MGTTEKRTKARIENNYDQQIAKFTEKSATHHTSVLGF